MVLLKDTQKSRSRTRPATPPRYHPGRPYKPTPGGPGRTYVPPKPGRSRPSVPSRGPSNPRGLPRVGGRPRFKLPLRPGSPWKGNIAQTAFDGWNDANGAIGAIVAPVTGYKNRQAEVCGPGSSFISAVDTWPSCSDYVTKPPTRPMPRNPATVSHWGEQTAFNPVSQQRWFQAGTRYRAVFPFGYSPMGTPAIYPDGPMPSYPGNTHPDVRMPTVPKQIPRAMVPWLAPWAGRAAGYGGGPPFEPPFNPGQPWGPPDKGTDPEDPHPPKPRERERKARAPAWLRQALAMAYHATETKDAIDAIFEGGFTKAERKLAGKTGVTMKGAFIGEGVAYTSTYDKAKFIYDNLDKMNYPGALAELAKNHLTDEMLGRIFGGADQFANRNLGGNRVLLF